MKHITEHIRQHALGRAAYTRITKVPCSDIILKNNWFPKAIKHMQNRMVLGFFRYGYFRDPKQPDYDSITSAKQRLQLYQNSGNTEHLIDVMNLCGIEFETPKHPKAHFKALDDHCHHTKVK